jgi:biopolymer transport protein ExbD
MARRKQRAVEEEGDPEMNMSSMMDACFLLLIYFIVATSLVSEKRLSVSLPGDSAASGTPPPLEPGRVKIDASGAVYWNGDMPMGGAINPGLDPRTPEYRQERELNELVEALKNLAEAAKAADTNPIVMVEGAPATPHQRIVDVMAALSEAGINTVGLNTSASE